MTWPPVLVDEDFPFAVALDLRRRSTSAVTITVEGARRGATDANQVDRAAALGAVLLSHNQTERARFRGYVRRWRRRGSMTLSVLFLPRDSDSARLLLRAQLLLEWYAALALPKPETLIWNDVAQAIIVGFRPEGVDEAAIRLALG